MNTLDKLQFVINAYPMMRLEKNPHLAQGARMWEYLGVSFDDDPDWANLYQISLYCDVTNYTRKFFGETVEQAITAAYDYVVNLEDD